MIERLKKFFLEVFNSCYNLEFYREVRVRPLKKAVVYAVTFSFLLSIYFALVMVLPGMTKFSSSIQNEILSKLPEGSSLSFNNGHLTSNLPAGTEIDVFNKALVVVVDDTLEGNSFPVAFEDRVGVFLGRDTLFWRGPDGSQETVILTELPNLLVTRENILANLETWKWPVIITATILLGLVKFVVGFLSILIDALTVALLALLVSNIWKLKLRYKQWLVVGLYAATLPALIDTIAGTFSFYLPFVSTVVYLMLVLAVAMDERSRPTNDSNNLVETDKTVQ